VSAFEEMKNTGQVDRETFSLFVWQVPSIAKRYGMPPPGGAKSWTREVCVEWVLEFFDRKGHEVAVKLFNAATDEASFGRVVRRAIENQLKDEAKATTAGKLRSRMRTLLTPQTDFIDATQLHGGDPAWTLEGLGDEIYSGDWMDLLTAPALKAIEPIKQLNPAGPTSRENSEKLVNAARIILQTAGGAIRDQVLATALVHLFELDAPDLYLIRESDEGTSALPKIPSPEAHVEAIEAADAIIFALSPDEGRALLVIDEPLAEAAAYLPDIADIEEFLAGVKVKIQGLIERTELPPGTFDRVLDWFRRLPRT
jgi:hypothetical protein